MNPFMSLAPLPATTSVTWPLESVWLQMRCATRTSMTIPNHQTKGQPHQPQKFLKHHKPFHHSWTRHGLLMSSFNFMTKKLVTRYELPTLDWFVELLITSHKVIILGFNTLQGSPVGYEELDWFADIGLFHDQLPKATQTAAQVPELPTTQASNTGFYRANKFPVPQASDTGFYRGNKCGTLFKKPRLEISDEEEYFTVPDLG